MCFIRDKPSLLDFESLVKCFIQNHQSTGETPVCPSKTP